MRKAQSEPNRYAPSTAKPFTITLLERGRKLHVTPREWPELVAWFYVGQRMTIRRHPHGLLLLEASQVNTSMDLGNHVNRYRVGDMVCSSSIREVCDSGRHLANAMGWNDAIPEADLCWAVPQVAKVFHVPAQIVEQFCRESDMTQKNWMAHVSLREFEEFLIEQKHKQRAGKRAGKRQPCIVCGEFVGMD